MPTTLQEAAGLLAAGAIGGGLLAWKLLGKRDAHLDGPPRRTAFASHSLAGDDAEASATHNIVLTGGPCGGKSTALAHLKEALQADGFEVFTVPEVPTMLILGGAEYPGLDAGARLEAFEHGIINVQLAIEEAYRAIARCSGRKSVVIHDRALLDIAAYLPPDMWADLISVQGLTMEHLHGRYDAVVHLVTAADGAEEHYSKESNAARTESAEEARDLDQKVLRAWENHHNQLVVPNPGGGFEAKLSHVIHKVLNMCT